MIPIGKTKTLIFLEYQTLKSPVATAIDSIINSAFSIQRSVFSVQRSVFSVQCSVFSELSHINNLYIRMYLFIKDEHAIWEILVCFETVDFICDDIVV